MLRATVDLLEEVGYGRLTIEGVAAKADVAKSTIYRWWTSKPALVMDAYGYAVTHRVPEPDTGTVAGDLTALLTDLYRVGEHPARVRALRGLMAEAQLDPEFAEAFRNWIETRRAIVAELLDRAVNRGELPSTVDHAVVADLVFGPFWYRLLVGHAPLDPRDAAAQADRVLAAARHGLEPPARMAAGTTRHHGRR
ncbi:MAG: TetR/AcrR family transcriptional regulator [Hamadaea sp.]|nr:TetR/AcrR family transcriptional regulator [Hamadaea sp.]